jgi:hypothetical protein
MHEYIQQQCVCHWPTMTSPHPPFCHKVGNYGKIQPWWWLAQQNLKEKMEDPRRKRTTKTRSPGNWKPWTKGLIQPCKKLWVPLTFILNLQDQIGRSWYEELRIKRPQTQGRRFVSSRVIQRARWHHILQRTLKNPTTYSEWGSQQGQSTSCIPTSHSAYAG